eukprot:g37586.t1
MTEDKDGVFVTEDPGGYKFFLVNKERPKTDPVQKVTLAVSDLQRSINFWSNLLGMKVYTKDDAKRQALLGYADDQCKLELQDIGSPVDHGSAYGRIAFSCPREQLGHSGKSNSRGCDPGRSGEWRLTVSSALGRAVDCHVTGVITGTQQMSKAILEGQHGGSVVSTAASQPQGPRFDSTI